MPVSDPTTRSVHRDMILRGAALAESLVRQIDGTGGAGGETPITAWAGSIADVLAQYGVTPEHVGADAARLGPIGVAPEVLGLGVARWAPSSGTAALAVRQLASSVGASAQQCSAAVSISSLLVELVGLRDEHVSVGRFLGIVRHHLRDQDASSVTRHLQASRRTTAEVVVQLRSATRVAESLHPLVLAVISCAHHGFDLRASVQAIEQVGERAAVLVGGLLGAVRGDRALRAGIGMR
jgi:hypothetical protein